MSERNFGETIKKNLTTNGYPYCEDQLNLVEERTENCNTVYSTDLAKRGSLIIDPSIIMDSYDKLCLVQSDVYVSPKSPIGDIFDHNHNVLDDFDVKILQTLPARFENFKVTVKVVAPKKLNYLQICPPSMANGGNQFANGDTYAVNGDKFSVNGDIVAANGEMNGGTVSVNGSTVVDNGSTLVINGKPIIANGGMYSYNKGAQAATGDNHLITDRVHIPENKIVINDADNYANEVQFLKFCRSNLNETDSVDVRNVNEYQSVVPVAESETTHVIVSNEEPSPKTAISYLDSVISEHDTSPKHVNSNLSFDVKIMAIPPKPCSDCFAVVIPVVLPKENVTSRS